MAEAVSRAIAEQGTADNAVTGECHVNLVIPPPIWVKCEYWI